MYNEINEMFRLLVPLALQSASLFLIRAVQFPGLFPASHLPMFYKSSSSFEEGLFSAR